MRRNLSFFASAFFTLAFFAHPTSALAAFSYERAIIIDHTKVPNTDQTNFPVLVSGTYSYLAATSSAGKVQNINGYDVGFYSNSSCTTKLNWETEKYVGSTGEVDYWVLATTTLSHTADTTFYLCYGDASITTDRSNKTAVWDSTFIGVYHLPDGSSLNTNDSTANANDGTLVNAPTAGTGKIDGAADFVAASDQFINLGSSETFDTTARSYSAWVKAASFPNGYNAVVSKREIDVGNYFQLFVTGDGKLAEYALTNIDNVSYDGDGSHTLSPDTWYYLSMTYDPSQGLVGYVNGEVDGTAAPNGDLITEQHDTIIGNDDNPDDVRYWDGAIDEVHVSNVARSIDWTNTEYNNQSSPSTFYSLGSEAAVVVDTTPPSVSISAPANLGIVSGASTAVAATATDNISLASVQFKLDGANLGTLQTSPTSGSTYSITWDTTGYANGSHSLTAVATDGAGNRTTSAITTVTIANTHTITPSAITSSVSMNEAIITWTTNFPASTQVGYSLASGGPYTFTAPADTSVNVTSHQVLLTGLDAGKTYYYEVKGTDGTNSYTSGESSFTVAPGSTPIASMTFGSVFKYNSNYPSKYINSDVWSNTWGSDGNIYTAHDDSEGWQNAGPNSNLQVSMLSDFATSTTGTLVNAMSQFGAETELGSDGASYKADGIISINGTLYLAVSRHTYPGDVPYIQTTAGAQIIKSTDFGVTWTPLPPATAQPYVSPMFPSANFSTPFFIQYGQDYQNNTADNSPNYVYAVSTDGTWNNGSHLYLGRVKVSDMPSLDATKWSFYKGNGADGMLDANWGTLAQATPIISQTRELSMNGVQYIPALHRYVLMEWYYPSIVNDDPYDTGNTKWALYDAPTPWGPWHSFQNTTWNPLGLYNPNIMPKSLTTDGGHTVMVSSAGDFYTQDPQTGNYTLILVPSTINTATPVISGVSSAVSTDSATVTWSTDVPTDTKVGYALTAGGPYTYTALTDTSPQTVSHSTVVTGLSAATTYYFIVVDKDAFATTATSSETTFTTAAADSPPAPASGGGGGVVGLVGSVAGTYQSANYVAPRPQIIYPDGHVVYLDTPSAPSTSPTSPSTPTNTPTGPSSGSITTLVTHIYQYHDTSSNIRTLQQFLNAHGFVITQTGAGSPGHESTYFGAATLAALKKFQKAHGLPATGYFGPMTRALVKKLSQ